MILSGAYTCIARADEIHRAVGYTGGAFDFRLFSRRFRDFRFAGVDRGYLPEGVDAVSRRDAEAAVVVYARDARPERLRFTIAHEIGHSLLHQPGEAHARGARSRRSAEEATREAQADFFAAELLMPAWAVDRALPADWRVHGGGTAVEFEHQVRRLARVFRVSRAAMRVQLEHYLHLRGSALGMTGSVVEHLR